jgi:hypothetical protein
LGERSAKVIVNNRLRVAGEDPVGATFWPDVPEFGNLGAFAGLGILSKGEARRRNDPDHGRVTVLYGRFVGNIDNYRRLSDLTPGADGRKFEVIPLPPV